MSNITAVIRRTARFSLGLAIVGVISLAGGSPARAAEPRLIETPIASLAPDAGQVLESDVSLDDPLPRADGPRPAACDRIDFLRFRSASGPRDPARADAVLVAQPGIFEGPAAFDQVARHVIETAAAGGRQIEFWALDPRANCLVDDTGLAAAQAAQQPSVALDYYFRDVAVAGHTFPGFTSEADAGWLGHVGLAQTMRDEYAVISLLPPAFRRTRVLCGGHSLGGILTGAFADWDFSGRRRPSAAGYEQCAGYFALDTRFSLSLATLSSLTGTGTGGPLGGLLASLSASEPYVDIPPITPQTLQSLPILGIASYFAPNARSTVVAALPDDPAFNSTLDLLLAGSWPEYLADSPDPRSFNVTNEAALGFVLGDVSQPIGILRGSIGVPTGGPVVEKSFPLPYGAPSEFTDLLGGGDLIVPPAGAAGPNGPLYGWLNYDQLPVPAPSPSDDPGHPYTSAESEVSDITQLSRALFDAGVPFTEEYYPTRLLLDLSAAALGVRTGTLRDLAYDDGIALRPAVYVDASDGLAPTLGPVPPGAPPQVHVVAAGYNHLDVLAAAAVQNNGQPELSSTTLAAWLAAVTPQS